MQDSRWVRKMLHGDKTASERFVTENYPRIYRLLRCLTHDTQVAEDLTQQTFMRAWQALSGYKGEASLTTWLHRIAYHEYTHWLRARRDNVSLELAMELADPRAVAGLETLSVQRALLQLSDDLRETFLLFYLQELSVAEVAAILELPPGTIKSRLFTARQRLRELLDETQKLALTGDTVRYLSLTEEGGLLR